jgi:hypothetical protein
VKSYAEVAEHLAVSLTATLRRIVDADNEATIIHSPRLHAICYRRWALQ